jgi:hypothetical protein
LLDGFIVRRGLVGSAALSDGNSVLLRPSVIIAAILSGLRPKGLTRRTDLLLRPCFAAMNWRSIAFNSRAGSGHPAFNAGHGWVMGEGFEGAQDFVGLEVGEEFGDGGGLAGEVVVRGEFGEGLKDEATQVGAWMRQGQERGGTCEIVPGDQVEVEGAGFVEDDLGASTELAF